MDVITKGWPTGNQVLLSEATFHYLQDEDNSGKDKDPQELIISTREGGGGNYFNIKTESWSFCEAKEIVDILKDFAKRTELIDENSCNT